MSLYAGFFNYYRIIKWNFDQIKIHMFFLFLQTILNYNVNFRFSKFIDLPTTK